MVRNSNQDALSEKKFEELLEATDAIPDPRGTEAYFILLIGGRLGMRAGEISHMKESWIDWDRKQIRIPQYEPCDKGQDGGICGYCREQARQAIEYNPDIALDDELNQRWKPKTSNSARAIPFDFSDRIEACLEAFFDIYDEYPHSRTSINRRMDAVAEAAGIDKDSIYPHCLRATAATWHAYRGLPTTPLQSLFGWNQISTASKYIRLSGGATQKALKDVHND